MTDTQNNRIETQRCEKSNIYSVKYWTDMLYRQEEPEFWIIITDLCYLWCVFHIYEKDVQDTISLPHTYFEKN